MVFREGRAPCWVFSLQRVIHSRSCSYYLFFNYLYVLPVWSTNRGGVLPVWYWITLSNHLHLWISLTAANRLGRPRSRFQPVGALLESLSLRNRAVRGYLWGRNGP